MTRSALYLVLIYTLLNWKHCDSKTISYNADFHSNVTVSKIAFGSCSNQHKLNEECSPCSQHCNSGILVENLSHTQEQTVVYADTRIAPLTWTPSALVEMAGKYQTQKDRSDYQEFLKSGVQVIGVWDDHDYGTNGGGKHYKHRLQAQGMFLDFLDEPVDSPRRRREGSYVSYLYGHGDRTVKVILLDTRSHSVKGDKCDILGQEQWQWLEQQLNDPNPPTVTIIGSGIQVLTDVPLTDKWQTCPSSHDRLVWLVQRTPRAFFISGDVHVGEFMCLNNTSTGYPLYEVTSSGMTASCVSWISEDFCRWLLTEVSVSTFRTNDIVTALNYGVINIHWEEDPISISLSVNGEKGTLLQQRVPLHHLEKTRGGPTCPPAVRLPSRLVKYGFYAAVWLLIGIIALTILRLFITLLKPLLLQLVLPLLNVHINISPSGNAVKKNKIIKKD